LDSDGGGAELDCLDGIFHLLTDLSQINTGIGTYVSQII
jgi:hypothetical protein